MSRALLLIHGFLTCTDDWDAVVPALRDLYDEVVAFKQPGHERPGTRPHYKDFTADACYSALDATMRDLGERFDEVDVAGHSMGGAMALYVASVLPNVRKAVIISPALRYPRPGAFARHNSAVSALTRMAAGCTDAELAAVLREKAAALRTDFGKAVNMFFKRLLPNWSPHNLLTLVRITRRAEKYADGVRCPVAVFWGGLDEFVPEKAAEVVLERAASAEKTYVRYARAGHAIMYIGEVGNFVRDMRAFLEDKDLTETVTEPGEARYVRVVGPNGERTSECRPDKLGKDVVMLRRITPAPADITDK